MKSEEEIRNLYRSYIELYASSTYEDRGEQNILYGAILAYGRVLNFNAIKIKKDLDMAKGKYFRTISQQRLFD